MSYPLRVAVSVHGHSIRLTPAQWTHVVEAHDYMAGNLDLVVETLSGPVRVISAVSTASLLTLRDYEKTNISQKTAVVIYRNGPDGFLITAFLTSKPGKIEQKGTRIWPR